MRPQLIFLSIIAAALLAACSGKSGGAPEIQTKQAEEKAPEISQEERRYPSVRAVADLSAGTPGFVMKQLAGLRNDKGEAVNMAATPAEAEVMVFNATTTLTDETIRQANEFLKDHKRLIVDSDGTPEGRLAVKAALTRILGGNAVDSDAALVAYVNRTDYTITPLANPPDPLAKNPDGTYVNGNVAANVLSLQ